MSIIMSRRNRLTHVHDVETHAQGVGRLARLFPLIVSMWQTPNPPPQQQPPYPQQPNQPPPQGAPWGAPPPPYYGGPAVGPPMPHPANGGTGRAIIGGLLIVFGVIIIVMFVALPWVSYDSGKMEDAARDFVRDSDYAADNDIKPSDVRSNDLGFDLYDGCKVTGLQTATRSEGNSKCPYDLVEDNFNVSYEPDLQPIVEYSVLTMGVLGLLIVVFGVMLIGKMGSRGMVLSFALLSAIVLTIFPFGWTQAYNRVAADIFEHNTVTLAGLNQNNLSSEDQAAVDFIVDLDVAYASTSYQTIQNTIVPLLTLLTVIAGFFVVGKGGRPPMYYAPPYQGQPYPQQPPYQQQPPPRY